jgi:multidrug efflux system membrane fusion protein
MKHIATILILVTLAACSKEAPPPAATAERAVMTMVVGPLAGDSSNLYSGEIRARYETSLGFRIGGKIVERMVNAGTRVQAGQALMRLDAADTNLQASAAEAQFHQAEAEVLRFRELHKQGFVSQTALDAKETAYKAALSQAGLSSNQDSYTVLRADHAGVVAAVLAEVGQVVGAGQAVFRLAQDGEREVAIAIPENRINSIKVGTKAKITIWGTDSEAEHHGYVRELSPMADAASRTYAARVTLSDTKSAVALGMTAQVRFGNSSSAAEWLVPSSAIFQQGDKSAVWIVAADHSISLRPVTISAYRDEGAVIAGGLSKGERIVTAGVHMLNASEKVRALDSGNAQ